MIRQVFWVFGAANMLCGGFLTAQNAQDKRVSWLKNHAVRFALQQSSSDDYADLEPLRKRLSKMRCVALGEAQHGDGTTFRAKVRLVRFLHEKCGFDVIAWESGLWDCTQAWKSFQASDARAGEARDRAAKGIFGVWTQSLQMADFWDYIAVRAKTDRPLELTGFDCQLTGTAAATFAADYGMRVAGITKIRGKRLQSDLDRLVAALAKDGAWSFDAAPVLRRLDAVLAKAKKSDERDFLQQCAKSLRGAVAARVSRKAKSPSKRFNPRDEAMADNLRWLLERRFKGKKVIVWAATMHIVRRAEGLPNPAMGNYRGVFPAGTLTAKWLGKDYFVVGFDCGGGETAFPWLPARKIAAPSSGSFAALAQSAGLETAWIDVRDARGDSPFAKPLVARPLGHGEMKARWAKHLDAMVYIPRMRRSRMWQDRATRDLARDPVAAFAASWKSSRARIAAGNAYAEKGVPEQWDDWIDLYEPNPEDLEAKRIGFEAWVKSQPAHPSLAWRVASMRASIAMSLDDAVSTKKHLDVAIASYVDKDFAKPLSMSGFQHLVNRRAKWLFEHEGVSAMIASVVGLLASDPRFDYFYGKPLRSALTGSTLTRTRGAVLRALEKRAKNFPADAASIKQRMTELRAAWGG